MLSKEKLLKLYSLRTSIFSHIDLSETGIRKFLTIVLVISFIYSATSFIYPIFGLNKIRLPDVAKERKLPLKQRVKEEPKPLEFYTQGTENHSVFSSSGNLASPGPAAAADADLIKGINLVGIISGVNPQAIIEDKASQKSFYLSRGQFLGELCIEDIQEGKVILSYHGARYELSM
jgi:hypothetical protein